METNFRLEVSGDEERVRMMTMGKGGRVNDFVDDLLDAGEFDDDEDMVYDEYLMN